MTVSSASGEDVAYQNEDAQHSSLRGKRSGFSAGRTKEARMITWQVWAVVAGGLEAIRPASIAAVGSGPAGRPSTRRKRTMPRRGIDQVAAAAPPGAVAWATGLAFGRRPENPFDLAASSSPPSHRGERRPGSTSDALAEFHPDMDACFPPDRGLRASERPQQPDPAGSIRFLTPGTGGPGWGLPPADVETRS